MNYHVTDAAGRTIQPGDTVTDFRGKPGQFERVTRQAAPGKSARVVVDRREYYASVFGLTVTTAEALQTCSFCGAGKPCDCGIQYADIKQ